jgi:hypothetical protein
VTIRRVDARYAAGALDVVQVGRHNWRIAAERPTWDAWRELRAEHAAVREQIARSLGTSARPERPSGVGSDGWTGSAPRRHPVAEQPT